MKMLRTAGFIVSGSMIFERSPSAYFSQSRSEALIGKRVARNAHDRLDSRGTPTPYTSRNASR